MRQLWSCTLKLKGLPKTMNAFRFEKRNYAIERRKWFYAITKEFYAQN
jgi:hypothetical protein